MTKKFTPYVELHVLYDYEENLIEVDGYIHEDETQGYDNFVQSFTSMEVAERWAKQYNMPVKFNIENTTNNEE